MHRHEPGDVIGFVADALGITRAEAAELEWIDTVEIEPPKPPALPTPAPAPSQPTHYGPLTAGEVDAVRQRIRASTGWWLASVTPGDFRLTFTFTRSDGPVTGRAISLTYAQIIGAGKSWPGVLLETLRRP